MENRQTLDDITLVKQAQSGDIQSTETLLIRYMGLARSKARRFFLADGTVDDLCQEGWLGVYKAILDFDSDKNNNFISFVDLCVTSKIHDAIRTSRRGKHKLLNEAVSIYTLDENMLDDTFSNPLNTYAVYESKEDFYTELSTLLNPTQLSILKYYLNGYTYTEIAEKLNVPLKKIDNTLHTVKLKIKKNKALFRKE